MSKSVSVDAASLHPIVIDGEYPRFGNVYLAVFNCTSYGKRIGRRAVVDRYGNAGWKKVKSRMKSGIMEIFSHPPMPETQLYVEVVGKHAEKHHSR